MCCRRSTWDIRLTCARYCMYRLMFLVGLQLLPPLLFSWPRLGCYASSTAHRKIQSGMSVVETDGTRAAPCCDTIHNFPSLVHHVSPAHMHTSRALHLYSVKMDDTERHISSPRPRCSRL